MQFFELRLSFGKRGFGHRDDAAAGFFPLPAQTHDAPDFVQAEAERLRLADKAHLVQRARGVGPVVAASSRLAFRIDDEHERLARWHAASRCWCLPIHTAQTNLPYALPRPARIHHDPLA